MDLALTIPLDEVALRLGLAALCGALLGVDREVRGKDAGLRTHTLVSVSAAATTLVALEMYGALDGGRGDLDPIRVIQGLAQAIGFISAGVIIRRGADVHGATTAAVIWIAGALGIACGAGIYAVALMATVISLAVLIGLKPLERRLFRQRPGDE
ncbi:MgtC/SapB family protein [Azospirillum halopraeferens]|uniref:MgtC/SapB family protein n=1 Tax=Azospirillum halopraeferens TaxID=34010 RepID=UPI00041C3A02|nr:MgtC/SapB family protein [Azospirillum halopraeferens]